MNYFSVPSDFNTHTLENFDALNQKYSDSKVIETYGQLTVGSIVSSGRVIDVLPEVNYKALEKFVKYGLSNGIEFNYTLNPACFGNQEFTEEGIEDILTLLQTLYDIGITHLTVSSPPLFELVSKFHNQFKLKASAICEISSVHKALFYRDIGASRIVVDPDITRDFQILKNITGSFNDGVEIIINNVCLKNCAYKMFHYNHEAHRTPDNDTQTITDYYFNRCSMQKAEKISNLLKLNWIRPQDLHFYEKSGIRNFKIQGRQNVLKGNVMRALKAYFDKEFDGDLFELITLFAPYNSFQPCIDTKKLDGFVEKFFTNTEYCQEMCGKCGWCEKYAKKSIDFHQAEKLNAIALEYYHEKDKYLNLNIETMESVDVDVNLNFDFELKK